MTQAPPQWTPQTDVDPKAAAKAAKAYAKATRPWYKKKRYIFGGVVVAAIAIGAGSSAGGSGTSVPAASDNATGTSTTSSSSTTSNAQTASKPAAAKPAAHAITLLNVKGNGAHTTQKFTAAGDWDLKYSYNCANFGYQGNFMVMVYGSDGNMSLSNDGPNELGKKGAGVDHEHNGGTYYLEINSECSWTVKVIG